LRAHRSTSVSKQQVEANVQVFASWPQKRRARVRRILRRYERVKFPNRSRLDPHLYHAYPCCPSPPGCSA
jgi:hypothetical protein